ncbi:hypothetical protein GJ631_03415 [Natronomonas sp. CBA1123]|jgi:hypothetical protein|uniref:DUF7860 family protein n=1 Tax=Natronomonas sp. CBA1123 TaxID=2668070 RepID=UPI0012EA815B|nr:hypothetical protein [Natronomonas sp. CBA1123]MUV85649.1 hypothetical protein [Natronomonas sp. CBA1123]
MSHQTGGRSLDHARLAKLGFLFGVGLFAVGAVGEIGGHAFLSTVPATLDTVFFGMETLGVVVGLVTPIVFGAVLPLIE